MICRYGGEEILISLPGADEKTGMQAAEKIRQKIEAYHFPKGSKITVSIGGVTSDKTTKTATDLIELADSALYKVKEKRNQCAWSGEPPLAKSHTQLL